MRLALMMRWGCLATLLGSPIAFAQSSNPLQEITIGARVDSGLVRSASTVRGVIYETVVRSPAGTPWMRVKFDVADLGRTTSPAQPSVIRLTSMRDGASQTMNALHLQQWQNTSAYFNGAQVRVQVIADADSPPCRIVIHELIAGAIDQGSGGIATICGTDDRVLSSDPRAARIVPVGCTAWIINDVNHTFLTAGHCATTGLTTVEFNVPLSTSGGAIVHPPPEDQYAVDPASVQFTNGGIGNDYCYFGCFANTNTSLTPFQRQAAFFTLAPQAPPVSGQTLRVTGYGTDSTPSQNNQVQQTSNGPYSVMSGSALQYAVDTTGGNSGSPVIDETTGMAIGIHTNGGCTATGGTNSGTAVHNAGLLNALANPQGVCVPLPKLIFGFPNGLPTIMSPGGATIRVVVSGANGGTPQRGSGMVFYSTGAAFTSASMIEVSPNVYDAVFPPKDCTDTVQFYFTAQTTDNETVVDPRLAPTNSYSALSAYGLTLALQDDIEGSITGWIVASDASLTSGAWEQAIPVGTLNGTAQAAPAADHTPDPGVKCFVTQNGLPGGAVGNADIDGGATRLTSPAFSLAGADAVISYARWFYTNSTDDYFRTEISNNNGSSWATVSTITSSTMSSGNTAWQVTTFVASHFVLPSAQMKLRFTAADAGAANIVEAGLDDLRVDVIVCTPPPPPCAADIDHNLFVNVDDLLVVINTWGQCPAAPPPPPSNCPADIAPAGGDGFVNVDDLLAVINAWGPCP